MFASGDNATGDRRVANAVAIDPTLPVRFVRFGASKSAVDPRDMRRMCANAG